MKIKFSETETYIPEWNENRDLPKEEQVSCTLTVFNMGSLLNILDAFNKVGIDGQVDTEKLSTSKIRPLLEQFGDLLPNHVHGVRHRALPCLYGAGRRASDEAGRDQ